MTGTPAAGSDLRRVLLGYWTADGMAGALTLTLNLASADTPASRLLDAAFPREAENIIAAAPYNYQGLAGRIHSRDAGVTVLFSPAATDGISLAADGGVYAARPVSRAMRAVFAVTATVLGTEEGARRARRLSVSVEIAPLERVPMIIVNATEGDNLSAVSLLAERAAPTDPRFRGATLRLAANAAPPDGFTRAGDDVLGPVSLAAGDFDIPFEVVGPGFLGDDPFPGVFRLPGNPAAPQELRFNNVGLVRRMWRTEILSDASGQQFNAAYWGRRRGLHFMTAPLGNVRIAEEPLLMRTAPGFETAKRRDPARADSPDTRWSLADYAAFCRAGGDSGLSGRRWRLPTIGEVAALVAPGKNQGADWLPLPRRFGGIGIPGLVPSGNLRIPLPPNDGQDTWGPLPPGLMGAVNAGAPIVPGNDAGNTPTSGKLWAAGIAQGGYRAFLPWESRESRASSQGWTRLFQGAVGYAACVVEAEDSYQPQPRLAVMEFSYAGKEKRCQISASPTEHCNEAGDFRSVGFVDSSLLDESELQISVALAAVAPSAASSARVFKVVTARALHFGGVNGAAEISSLPGEAALAEISVIASGADAPGLDDGFALVRPGQGGLCGVAAGGSGRESGTASGGVCRASAGGAGGAVEGCRQSGGHSAARGGRGSAGGGRKPRAAFGCGAALYGRPVDDRPRRRGSGESQSGVFGAGLLGGFRLQAFEDKRGCQPGDSFARSADAFAERGVCGGPDFGKRTGDDSGGVGAAAGISHAAAGSGGCGILGVGHAASAASGGFILGRRLIRRFCD